jgi:hypothetical protein
MTCGSGFDTERSIIIVLLIMFQRRLKSEQYNIKTA